MHEVRIIQNSKVAFNSYILSFPRFFEFLPGQVISIFYGNEKIRRIYSIASGIHDEEVDILYKVYQEGLLTPVLQSLKKGDSLIISSPYGSFTGFSDKAVLVATGTGVAPFASIFFSGMWKDKILIHGSRTLNEFYFMNNFLPLKEKYIRCCSGEKHDGIYHGRVTDYLQKDMKIEKNIMYYLCGSAEMITDVRDLLIDRGVSFANIFAEIYF